MISTYEPSPPLKSGGGSIRRIKLSALAIEIDKITKPSPLSKKYLKHTVYSYVDFDHEIYALRKSQHSFNLRNLSFSLSCDD
jgi:hypothetical protein